MPNAKHRTQVLGSVFSCLYQSAGPLTKQEIAQAVGISLPTVNLALAELGEHGLLADGVERESTGGRPATAFTISRETTVFIGISVTGHSLRTVVCNLFGEELGEPIPRRSIDDVGTACELASVIAAAVRTTAVALEGLGSRVAGVGVAVPSAIDPHDGRLLNTRVLHLSEDVVYARDLVGDIAYPVDVFNDANCGALAERFPVADGTSYAYLSLERGVGGAIIIDGIPFEGPRGIAAEFGHICIEPGGKPCACGKAGCLEAYCSSNVLSKELGCTLDEFFERVEQGDSAAVGILDDYMGHLAHGVQAIRAALGCEVVIGGTLASYLSPHFSTIRDRVQELDPFWDGTPIVRMARNLKASVPKGAADAIAQRFIKEMD